MRFLGNIPVVNGSTDPSPIANPAQVSTEKIANVGYRVDGSDSPPTTLRLVLEGAAAETATVEIYAIEDLTLYNAEGKLTPATASYALVTVAVVLTANVISTVNVPSGGPFYFRVTAETVAADRRIKVGSWVS